MSEIPGRETDIDLGNTRSSKWNSFKQRARGRWEAFRATIGGKQNDQLYWRPTKDFYLNNSRSNEIRSACLEALIPLAQTQEDPNPPLTNQEREDLSVTLERVNGKLIELGIKPNLHVGTNVEILRNSPVMTAEWVAGQLLSLLGDSVTTTNQVGPIIGEYNILPTDHELSLTSGKNLPPKLVNFLTARQQRKVIGDFLDIDSELEERKKREIP